MSKDLKELEGKIGYKFDDFTLFTKAMIHSSYANEKHLPKYECNERLEFLGDAVLELGEQLLCHDGPGGAAAGAHEGQLLRHLRQEILGLLHGAQVRADGHLHHIVKAQDPHGGLQLGRRGGLAELAHKGGGHAGDDLGSAVHGVDDLEDLALVRDGGEGAVHQAHAAGDALVVVDLGPAQLVGADGVHAAGCGAGALNLADGVVGALVEAPAAFDALVLVNVAMLVLVQINGILGAHIHARMGQAALAAVRNPDLLGGAGIAGKGDDIDQGLLKIFVVGRGRLLDTGADGRLLASGLQAHAKGQPHPLLDNGPLQKHVVAVAGHLSGNDGVGDHVHPLQIPALIGQAGLLCEYVAANIVYRAVYTSHVFPPVSGSSRILLRHR